MHWDIFCRVVDNFGDVGVCWRLAADLAGRGQRVRLFIDDAAPLAFMAPAGAAGVQVCTWRDADDTRLLPGDVVIEAFGCDPPPAFVHAMLQRAPAPCWINLEYLSAEPYVERSHGLPSPQRNGLRKWFFYPGFTPRTGGLLREPGLMAARGDFDRRDWLAAQGLTVASGERVVSLFCYDNAALPALLHALAPALSHDLSHGPQQVPTLLLLTQGAAQRQVMTSGVGQHHAGAAPAGLRLHQLPWLSQHDFDRMLWASDINFVRGEDSLVRALWAGAPCVWQIYPQDDNAHIAKLDAMLAHLQAPPAMAALWRAWNGLAPWPGLPSLAAGAPAAVSALAARAELLEQHDLVTQLHGFVQACTS